MASIQRLDPAVVNRIAAGEVVQRPSSALKELIENCLDAKSTSIQVTVKSGGLKLLQIQDNGHGIRKGDMGIVCERFTTSKLQKFEDLNSIQTYGFRGEALASISHVAHLSIVTRTADSKCAFKASYCDGKLTPPKPGASADPKPCAGNVGTQITVEDVFYNMPTRQRALKSASEEYSRIQDVMTRYAVHNAGVSFTLKKHGEGIADIRTAASATRQDNVRTLYGANIAKELLEMKCADDRCGMRMAGLATNANFSTKKLVFLLFINHRLVDCVGIRRMIENVYSAYLPKNSHPFMYMSLEILPSNVDVNVHPTKHEVHFLHEEAIFEQIRSTLEETLVGANTSRTMFVQSRLPCNLPSMTETESGANSAAKVQARQMVRTDNREQTLDAFLRPQSQSATTPAASSAQSVAQTRLQPAIANTAMTTVGDDSATIPLTDDQHPPVSEGASAELAMDCGDDTALGNAADRHIVSTPQANRATSGADTSEESLKRSHPQALGTPSSSRTPGVELSSKRIKRTGRPRRDLGLTSINTLIEEVKSVSHPGITEILRNHKFVGCAQPTHSLFQYQTKLYMINTYRLSQELFYQLFLHDFANFGALMLEEPLNLKELALLALQSAESGWTAEDGPQETLAQNVMDFFKTKAEMLDDYLCMRIDENGCLRTLPLLLENFVPNLDGLPMLVLRLATEVDWTSEQGCFDTLAKEFSYLYAYKPTLPATPSHVSQPTAGAAADAQGDAATDSSAAADRQKSEMCFWNNRSYRWIVEHVLFPAFRSRLLAPRRFADDTTLIQLADLPDLYRVFERC
eukprot:scpid39131/ scgid30620/ DNA mismatch repair protein Mlh1; MutL protein homolog 1